MRGEAKPMRRNKQDTSKIISKSSKPYLYRVTYAHTAEFNNSQWFREADPGSLLLLIDRSKDTPLPHFPTEENASVFWNSELGQV